MPICAQNLIQHQTSWITATLDTPLNEAFTLMIEHDYSQLPVVDENLKALGLVTSESITRALLNLGTGLKDLRVKDALLRQKFRQADEYLLDLLDSLSDSAALIVDGNDKLVGIITVHDTNQFFRERAEDIVRVEDIETSLKKHIRIAYAAKNEDSEALKRAIAGLGNSQNDNRKECQGALQAICSKKGVSATPEEITAIVDAKFPVVDDSRSLDDLTLYEYIQLGRKAWDKLEPVFGISVKAWSEMMNSVREVRNKIMHFKGNVTPMERDRLRYCADWYTGHQPQVAEEDDVDMVRVRFKVGDSAQQAPPQEEQTQENQTIENDGSLETKYAPLAAFLRNRSVGAHSGLAFTFSSIEEILGQALPKAAKEHAAWWTDASAQARHWLAAGWKVVDVNFQSGYVQFRRSVNPTRVTLDESWEVTYWCHQFGCTEAQLREAWRKTGPRAKEIQAYLNSPDQRMARAEMLEKVARTDNG